MGKRSPLLGRAGVQQKRRVVGPAPPSQNETKRRVPWAARLLIVAAGLVVVTACSVAVFHSLAADPTGRKSDAPRDQEVEELIRRYFRTWSSHDMKGYGDCFLSNSCIQFIDAQGRIEQFALPAFLANQGDLLRAGQDEAEVPESIDIRFESRLARVVVYWKLTTGSREVFGYDHFTLMKRNGKWGIVNLVFYETKRSG
jgi:hypothetical protein